MTTTLKSSRRLAGRWGACGTGVPPMEPKAATALERTARMAVPRRGYSLAELVLALGVLAIGMTMAAALFPAAIKLNELSTRDSIGTIVATNGLAIAQAVLKSADVPNANLQSLENVGEFQTKPWLLQYPAEPNDGPTTRGCLVLARPLNGTYQLVIISYDKYSANNEVKARNVTFSVEGETAVQVNDTDAAQSVGAPLIYIPAPPNDHAIVYARITGYDPKTGQASLDHPIDSNLSNHPGFVVVEQSGAMVLKKSPVMAVLVAETTLRTAP